MRSFAYFLKISGELAENEISFIVLKGPILSKRIYGDPYYRTSHDFDLLFKPEDLAEALTFFKNRGFEGVTFKWPTSEKKSKNVLHLLNQYLIHHEEYNIYIEIHWKLFSYRFCRNEIVRELVCKHTSWCKIEGQKLRHLSTEFELIYLVVHGGMHAWFRLKWLIDIHKIIQTKPIDDKLFRNFAVTLGAERFIAVCNELLQKFFPDSEILPGSWSSCNKLADEALHQINRPSNDPFDTLQNTIRLIRYQMTLSKKWRHKADVIRILLFNKKDLEIEWLPSNRYFIYLFRPLGYILRKAGMLK